MINPGTHLDRRMLGVPRARRLPRLHEELAVPHRLDDNEDRIKNEGTGGDKDCLHAGQVWARHRGGEIRQDEAEDRERHDGAEVSVRAFEIVALLAMAQAAEEEREPDQTIERDHEDGKHHVARKGGIVRAMQHRGRDHHHFDRDGGECEDERAVGFAAFDRKVVGMAHYRDGGPKDGPEEPEKNRGEQEGIGQAGGQEASRGVEDCRRAETGEKRVFRTNEAGQTLSSRRRKRG